jgi:NadR type nicotinamide-nucleotide adenylyltransferase
MNTGLTLGKYAPLHAGHQHVIETAISNTEHVVVLIYDCPETTNVPLQIRAKWIKDIYPNVEVIEAWDAPKEVGDTPKAMKLQEDYILEILNGKPITHFFCSEFYGDHVSKALSAKNCLVDEARTKIPISGTEIRSNPYQCREYLSPRVYKDLIVNVVFLGAPSTGKTTLARSLASEYVTVWMPEYGREYWEKNQIDRRLTLHQLDEIAIGHIQREEQNILEANQYLFTDTNALTTLLFSLYYHDKANPKLYELAAKSSSRYDLVFLCEDDIPFDDTWDRSGELNRKIFQDKITSELITRKIPFFRLNGSLEERIKIVKRILKNFKKYTNILDMKYFRI